MNGKKLVLTKNVRPVQKDEKPQEKEPSTKKEIKCKPAQAEQSDQSEPAQKEKPAKTLKCKQTSGKAA
jgi:cell envelope opacity-associated protein A